MQRDAAEDTCQRQGGHLLWLENEMEYDYVSSIATSHMFWVGLKYKRPEDYGGVHNEASWPDQQNHDRTVDLRYISYWDINEPDQGDGSTACGVAQKDKGLALKTCTRFRPFFCKYEACLQGQIPCATGGGCYSESDKCDGRCDCDDHSDEQDCHTGDQCTYYYKLTETEGNFYTNRIEDGTRCSFILEAPIGKRIKLTIPSTTATLEENIAFLEIWTGSPDLNAAIQMASLTGQTTEKNYISKNNFLTVLLMVGDVSTSRNGITLSWTTDIADIFMDSTQMTVDGSWKYIHPPFTKESTPLNLELTWKLEAPQGEIIMYYMDSYDQSEDAMLVILEGGMETSPMRTMYPADVKKQFFASAASSLLVYWNSGAGMSSFKLWFSSGCNIDIDKPVGALQVPNFWEPGDRYPSDLTCTWTLTGGQLAGRGLDVNFILVELDADPRTDSRLAQNKSQDYITIWKSPTTPDVTETVTESGKHHSPGGYMKIEFKSDLIINQGVGFIAKYSIDCPLLENLMSTNTILNPPGTATYESSVTVTCQLGYNFDAAEYHEMASVELICKEGGIWTYNSSEEIRLPNCKVVQCGVPDEIQNGYILSVEGTSYEKTVTYKCNAAFTKDPDTIAKCNATGMWENLPACTAANCVPSEIELSINGYYTVEAGNPIVPGNDVDVNTVVKFACDAGYELYGSLRSYCKDTGWSDPKPECRRIFCPFPSVEHIQPISTSIELRYEDTQTLTCITGYGINGNPVAASISIVCGSDRILTPDFNCSDINECDNNPCDPDTTRCENNEGSYKCICLDGYRATGDALVCDDIPQCANRNCDVNNNGYCVEDFGGLPGYHCGCYQGYILFTENGPNHGYSVAAGETGFRYGDKYYYDHTCIRVSCDYPTDTSHATILSRELLFHYQDTVDLVCEDGYHITGEAETVTRKTRTCGHDGTWDDDFTCSARTCSMASMTPSLFVYSYDKTTVSFGEGVVLTCRWTETRNITRRAICLYKEGTTVFGGDDITTCPQIDCGNPQEQLPSGGQLLTGASSVYLNNQSFTFDCVPGYIKEGASELTGDYQVQCKENGRWSFGTLRCSGQKCSDPGTPAEAVQNVTNYEADQKLHYTCNRAGYQPVLSNHPPDQEYTCTSMSNTADWVPSLATLPVCTDKTAPVILSLPTTTLYRDKMDEANFNAPSYTDNFGVKLTTATDHFKSTDIVTGSKTVTYTAEDFDQNIASASVVIEVIDRSIIPALTCPNYLEVPVESKTPTFYDVTQDVSSPDDETTFTFSQESVPVSVDEIGNHVRIDVTAANQHGTKAYCSFLVTYKANRCFEQTLYPDINADRSCGDLQDDGTVTCTSTCKTNYLYGDGSRQKDFTCSGTSNWVINYTHVFCLPSESPAYQFQAYVIHQLQYPSETCEDEYQAAVTQNLNNFEIQMTGLIECNNIFWEIITYSASKAKGSTEFFSNFTVKLISTQTTDANRNNCIQAIKDNLTVFNFPTNSLYCPGATNNVQSFINTTGLTTTEGAFDCLTQSYLLIVSDIGTKCIPCGPGEFYVSATSSCQSCSEGTYKSGESGTCVKCDTGETANTHGTNCIITCPAGFRSDIGLMPCTPCAPDTYWTDSTTCTPCESDSSTSGREGIDHSGGCYAKCPAGTYSQTGYQDMTCHSCPENFYQPNEGQTTCIACDPDRVTDGTGKTDISSCQPYTFQNGGSCDRAYCRYNGECGFYYHRPVCTCDAGFRGETCQESFHICDGMGSPCMNGGECVPMPGGTFLQYTCECVVVKDNSLCYDVVYSDKEGGNLNNPISQFTASLSQCQTLCLNNDACKSLSHYTSTFGGVCQLFGSVIAVDDLLDKTGATHYDKNCPAVFGGLKCEEDLKNGCSDPNQCSAESMCKNTADVLNGYECLCPSLGGYQGEYCDQTATLCDNVICENGGSCSNHENVRYECNCPDGYTGQLCEENIDECSMNSNACLFGTCNDLVNGYSCSCNGSFSGDRCQYSPNFCALNNNCLGNVCYNSIDDQDAKCHCEGPYFDQLGDFACSTTQAQPCDQINCYNSGTCTNLAKYQFRCDCVAGITGSLCQHSVDDCTASTCYHDGQCIDRHQGFDCDCSYASGYTGTQCELQLDYCSFRPCGNHGTCEDLVGDYVCHCEDGYTGDDCQTEIDECLSQPCYNGGTCTDEVNGFTCQCMDGWTSASNCQEWNELCTPGFCNNNGQCFDLTGDTVCRCVGGTQGENCDGLQSVCDTLSRAEVCLNSGECKPELNSAQCKCPNDYVGKACEQVKDWCSVNNNPCLHNGRCVTRSDKGFECICEEGYSGTMCEIVANPCEPSPCPSGASCRANVTQHYCQCPQGKEIMGGQCRSGTFRTNLNLLVAKAAEDYTGLYHMIRSSHDGGSHYEVPIMKGLPTLKTAFRMSGDTLSVQLWVRVHSYPMGGSYNILRLIGSDQLFPLYDENPKLVLLITGSGVQLTYDSETIELFFDPLTIGEWYLIGVSLDMARQLWYTVKAVEVQDPAVLNIGSVDFSNLNAQLVFGDKDMVVEFNRVTVWETPLDNSDFANAQVNKDYVANNAVLTQGWYNIRLTIASKILTSDLSGDVFNVDKTAPAINCDHSPYEKTSSDRIVRRSELQHLTEKINAVSSVMGASVMHSIPDAFTWGYYPGIVKVEANGRQALCRFPVYIKYNDVCPAPVDDGDVSVTTCDSSDNDGVCDLQCHSGAAYISAPRPRYKPCGALGVYDWKKPWKNLVLPTCAVGASQKYVVDVSMQYVFSINCDQVGDIEDKIKAEIRVKFKELNTFWDHICAGTDNCTNLEFKRAECGTGNEAKRINLEYSLNFDSERLTALQETGATDGQLKLDDALKSIIVLEDRIQLDRFASAAPDFLTVKVTMREDCTTSGYNPINGVCGPCGNGLVYNSSLGHCEKCPMGFYRGDNDMECQSCGVEKTTINEGATSQTKCVDECDIGRFYDTDIGSCRTCPRHYYQDKFGKSFCHPCQYGYKTKGGGTDGVDGCKESTCSCSASGDPHYKTFDGQLIHFQGVCTYRMAEIWHGDCGMIVNVKNIRSTRNPSVAYTRTLYVTVGADTLVIDQGRKITKNGMQQTTPYTSQSYIIFRHGNFIVVENNCNMQAWFDGKTTAKVYISGEDGMNATGICGNCNGVQDDFRLKDGSDVSEESNRYSLIGISHWDPRVDDIEKECNKEDEDIVCTDDIKQAIQSDTYCGLIRKADGPFGECIALSNAIDQSIIDTYYEECEYDVCALWGDVDGEVCSALETLLSYCYDIEASAISFRTDTFCPANCGENEKYVPYLTVEQPSCKNPNPSQQAKYSPEEGCLCADGYVLDNAQESCIPLEECGCVTEDKYYALGTNFLNEDCSKLLTCVTTEEGPILSEQTQPTCNNGDCKAVDGQYQCVCKDGFVLVDGTCRPEVSTCSCSASGDPHYKTFDGQLIHFQGVCTYRMAEIWHGDCGMIVNVKNIRSTRTPSVAYTRTVYVTVGADTIVIDQERKITKNGIQQTAPYTSQSYTIFRLGNFIVVENNCSMEAWFDGKTTAKVYISGDDGMNATGICGNCNGVKDDFRLKDGSDVSEESNRYSLIGISHWDPGVDDIEEECNKEDENIVCTDDIKQAIQSDTYCGLIRNVDGPFGECIALSNVIDQSIIDTYYEECEYDVCALWADADGEVCSALGTFLSYCYDIEASAISFRNDTFCPANCGENKKYVPYLTVEQPSCKDPNPSQQAKYSPEEGCLCADGYVLDNAQERCIPLEECGCVTEDKYYALGTNFLNEDCSELLTCVMTEEGPVLSEQTRPTCNNGDCKALDGQYQCVCKDGFVLVDGTCRPEACSCSASGDPHYKTFDGQLIHFQGVCTYRMAEIWHGDCGMIVNVKNIRSTRNPSVAYTRTVYVTVGTDTIVIDQGRKITKNGIQQTAPYTSQSYSIYRRGNFIVVENNCSMQAWFDGKTTAKVYISGDDGMNATGICGNCNGVQDDFRLKDGSDVSEESNRYSLIGISHWDPGVDDIEEECNKEDEDIVCTDDIKQAIQSDNYCGLIRKVNGPFGECIALSNTIDQSIIDTYYEECEYDVCALWADADGEVCRALETFLSYCYDIEASAISFRNDTFCPANCGENKKYVPYLTVEQPSCKDPNPSQQAKYSPEEGCLCADGYVLDNAQESCIPLEECGCVTEDKYYALGTNFLNEDCSKLLTCMMTEEGPILSEQTQPNCNNGDCKAVDGQYQCVCKDGFVLVDGTCRPEGLFIQPALNENSFTNTDDECREINFHPDFPINFNGEFHQKIFVCTNGLVTGGKPYTAYFVPMYNMEDDDFRSRFMFMPFFYDLRAIGGIGNIYHKLIETYDDETTSNDSDLLTTDDIIMKTQNLVYYKSKVVVKITWYNIVEFGDVTNQASRFQMVLSNDGDVTYVFYNYDIGGMNFIHADPFIGYVAPGVLEREQNSLDGDFLRHPDTNLIKSGQRGFVIYKVSKPVPNYKLDCLRWVNSESRFIFDNLNALMSLPLCPCHDVFLMFDRSFEFKPWWLETKDTYSVSMWPRRRRLPYGLTCAYSTWSGSYIRSGRNAGSLQRWNEFWMPIEHQIEDDYRHICCEKTNLCDRFHVVRPVQGCYWESFFFFGGGFGDPHVTTLDLATYTFNGWGEYILVDISDDDTPFQLQCRTDRAIFKDGTISDATIYSGFAARAAAEYGTLLQVELNDDRNGLLVWVNSVDVSTKYNNDIYYSTDSKLSLDIIVKRDKDVLQATFTDSSISVNITLANGMLGINALVPKTLNKTRGLMGNFNGDPNDDYIPRDSKTPLASNSTEQQIFFDFGKTWTTQNTDESLFKYHDGKTFKDYVTDHADFVPIFLDDVDKALMDIAIDVCNGTEDRQCLIDRIMTGKDEVAKNTQNVQIQAQETEATLANSAPTLTAVSVLVEKDGEFRLFLEKNVETSFTVRGSDDGAFTLHVNSTLADVGMTRNNNDTTISLTLTEIDTAQKLSIIVADEKKLETVMEIVLVVCSGCSAHGICDYMTIREVSDEDENYRFATCHCEPYWEGDDCEQDLDGCSDMPCSIGRNCTDRNAAAHTADPTLTAFTCGPCPTGFHDDGSKCADDNECQTNPSPCSQNCVNIPGSFACSCDEGFRLTDATVCTDINECDEQTSGCEQVCINIAGSYTCACNAGYSLHTDGLSCNDDKPPNPCSSDPCPGAHGCTVAQNNPDVALCFCRNGYQLLENNNTCTDRDECQLPVCSQTCINTEGSYTCGCHAGFKLSADRTTCTECPFPTYGIGCTESSSCGQGKLTFSNVLGCVCKDGWHGKECDTDIDECLDLNICGDVNKECANSLGSYTCTCRSGYAEANDGACTDVNECKNSDIKACDQICINTEGGFTCSCRSGYIMNTTDPTKCVDFDECKAGTSTCQQKCINVPGQYNCDCYLGFALNADRQTCRNVSYPCASFPDIQCSDICLIVDDAPKCSCGVGFKLAADNQTCIDIKECDDETLNKCTEKDTCLDTEGGYVCSCSPGFKLENDDRTCTACDGFYGENCENECACGFGAERCDPVNGCVCKEGWGGPKCADDNDECSLASTQCSGDNMVCVNQPGNYSCQCKKGFEENGQGVCADIKECSSETPNDCSQLCTELEGGHVCSCYDGYQADGNSCKEINECEIDHGCSQKCINTPGSFKCACNTGFRLLSSDLKTCIPENQCTIQQKTNCGAHSDCTAVDNIPICICKSGFEKDSNDACVDILECNQDPSPCSHMCTETTGGYICSCDQPGNMLDKDKKTCIACPEGKRGDNCLEDCQCNVDNTKTCNSTTEECTCFDGWEGTSCEDDINECNNGDICPEHSVCSNTNGSYYCQCTTGHSKTAEGKCRECDGTTWGVDCLQPCVCDLNHTEKCNNVDGSCQCKAGWERQTCDTDVVECDADPNPCNDPLKDCSNSIGSFVCSCKSGYRIDASLTCHDINECLEGTDNCSQKCTNTVPGFTCSCFPGYLGIGNDCTACPSNKYGIDCSNTCDCVTKNTKDATQTCDRGTGVCHCKDSWQGTKCELDICDGDAHGCNLNEICYNNGSVIICRCAYGLARNADNICSKDCGNPEVPANGRVTLNSGYSTTGSLATQYCNLGYDLEGSTTIVCLDTGEWSEGPVTCTMKNCGRLYAPVNGKVNDGYGTLMSTYGAVANITCDNGFSLTGLAKKECGSNGVWSVGANATCTKKATATCGNPTAIQHATYVYNNDGTEATYICMDGYELANAAQNKLQCSSAANQWTGTQFPVCNLKEYRKMISDLTMTLGIDLVDTDLGIPTVKLHFMALIKEVFQQTLRASMNNPDVDIIITNIRIGSLIVTYDVIFPSDAIHTFLDVTTQLLESNATIEIDGNKGEVISIQLNNETYTPSTAADYKCKAFKTVEGACKSGYSCDITGGITECRADKKEDNFAVIIWVGVGVPLGLLAIVLLVVLGISISKKYRRRNYRYSESNLSEGDPRRHYPAKLAIRYTGGYGRYGTSGYYGPQHFESFSESQPPSRHRYAEGEPESNFSRDFMYNNQFTPKNKFEIPRPKY